MPRSGFFSINSKRSGRKKPMREHFVLHIAVADRGDSSSNANSPKKSPSKRTASSFSPPSFSAIVMEISPSCMMYMPNPGSPWKNTGSAGWYSLLWTIAATSFSSRAERCANAGTLPRRDSVEPSLTPRPEKIFFQIALSTTLVTIFLY